MKSELHTRPGFRVTTQAYFCLMLTHFALFTGGFPQLYRLVSGWRPRKQKKSREIDCKSFMQSVETACLFYFRRVRCLQYAAALVCLLRLHGVPAELVIGVAQNPFASHAWVELDGIIIAGADADQEHLQEIDRL